MSISYIQNKENFRKNVFTQPDDYSSGTEDESESIEDGNFFYKPNTTTIEILPKKSYYVNEQIIADQLQSSNGILGVKMDIVNLNSSWPNDMTTYVRREISPITILTADSNRLKNRNNYINIFNILQDQHRHKGNFNTDPIFLLCEIMGECDEIMSTDAYTRTSFTNKNRRIKELYELLNKIHLQALISAYGDLINGKFPTYEFREELVTNSSDYEMSSDNTNETIFKDDPQRRIHDSTKKLINILPPSLPHHYKNDLEDYTDSDSTFSSPEPIDLRKILNPKKVNSIYDDKSSIKSKPVQDIKLRHPIKSSNNSLIRSSLNSLSRSTSSLVVMRDLTTQTIKINRSSAQPLGITISRVDKMSNGQIMSEIIVERILSESLIDKQGILLVGDRILEINGQRIESVEAAQNIVRQKSTNPIEIKFVPGPKMFINPQNPNNFLKTYLRAFFSYNAQQDQLQPKGNIGVSFEAGDILEIIDKSDIYYWQARKLGMTRIGLIPSTVLVERKDAFNSENNIAINSFARATNSGAKRRQVVKKHFRVIDAAETLEHADIWSYEEVVQVPSSPLKCLILIGAKGVGRNSLKQILCQQNPRRFVSPTVDTTLSSSIGGSTSGINDRFVNRSQMEKDINSGQYLEWGEINGNLYGIRLQSLMEIISSGRTAVVCCQPESVKSLRRPDINPHVVFLAAPDIERMKAMYSEGIKRNLPIKPKTSEDFPAIHEKSILFERKFRHLYDNLMKNDDVPKTAKRLLNLITRLDTQPQWVPLNWVTEMVQESVQVKLLDQVASGFVEPISDNFLISTQNDRVDELSITSVTSSLPVTLKTGNQYKQSEMMETPTPEPTFPSLDLRTFKPKQININHSSRINSSKAAQIQNRPINQEIYSSNSNSDSEDYSEPTFIEKPFNRITSFIDRRSSIIREAQNIVNLPTPPLSRPPRLPHRLIEQEII